MSSMSHAREIFCQLRLSLLRSSLTLLAVAGAVPLELPAQPVSPGVAVGVAIPTGRYGETRRLGPLSQLSLVFRDPESSVRFRFEAEGAWFPGRERHSALASSSQGDLRILSVLASVLLAPPTEGIRPYFVGGVGRQWLHVPGTVNPYGAVFGVRASAGLDGQWSGRRLRGEVGTHLVLSDYATGRDFALGTYRPLVVGVQF